VDDLTKSRKFDTFPMRGPKAPAAGSRYPFKEHFQGDPMAQLYLPAAHAEVDLVLAGQIAEWIDSGELYVAWTPEHGRSAPAVVAELRALEAGWTGTLMLVFKALRELWTALVGREPRGTRLPPPRVGEHAASPKPAAGEAQA